MKAKLAWPLAVGLSSCLLLTAPQAGAYCRTYTCRASSSCLYDEQGCPVGGVPIAWPGRCTSYSVHQAAAPDLGLDAPTVEALLAQAYSTWQSASCSGESPSIEVLPLPAIACGYPEYNTCDRNANGWIFQTKWTHDNASLTLGLTQVSFDVHTGLIHDADVEINVPQVLAGGVDIADVITHEAGHVLGLDHSPNFDATMFAQYSGRSLSTLGADDVAGICEVYPPNRRAAVCDAMPENGFARHCGTVKCPVSGCSAAPVGIVSFRGVGWVLAGFLVFCGRRAGLARLARASRR